MLVYRNNKSTKITFKKRAKLVKLNVHFTSSTKFARFEVEVLCKV